MAPTAKTTRSWQGCLHSNGDSLLPRLLRPLGGASRVFIVALPLHKLTDLLSVADLPKLSTRKRRQLVNCGGLVVRLPLERIGQVPSLAPLLLRRERLEG